MNARPTSGSGRSATSCSKPASRLQCGPRAAATSMPPAGSSRRRPRRSGGAAKRPDMLAPVRRALVRQVRATFNDRSKGQQPIARSDQALFARDSVIWRVHGDVTSMMAGGIAALLMQMLHPQALGGVWDHSDVHSDMIGRLRRTARFIAVTTYGEREAAEHAIERVREIHRHVGGVLPDGTEYRADDPHLLAWVHVAGALMFLDGWRRYGEPRMSIADQDLYFAEAGEVARMLGADPVP